jgi:hypothetical protein
MELYTIPQSHSIHVLETFGYSILTDYWDGTKRVVVLTHPNNKIGALVPPDGTVNTKTLKDYLKEPQ